MKHIRMLGMLSVHLWFSFLTLQTMFPEKLSMCSTVPYMVEGWCHQSKMPTCLVTQLFSVLYPKGTSLNAEFYLQILVSLWIDAS